MKKVSFICLLFFLACNLFALDFFPPVGGFVGIGPEVNALTRNGIAVGGVLLTGLDLNSQFSVGQRTAFFHNLDTVSALELLVFFRYYLPWLHIPKEIDGPFVQAEIGGIILFEHKEAFPAFSGGLSAGWRFNFGNYWYVEPALRLGTPHIWGIGLTAGIRFNNKPVEVVKEVYIEIEPEKQEIAQEPVVVDNEEELIITEVLVINEDGKLRIVIPPVYFRPNYSDFEELDEDTLVSNINSIEYIAYVLNKFVDYNIEVEGYANPTTPEGRARRREEPELKQLSESRAQTVLEELVKQGVDRNRLTYSGAGSSRLVVPYNDTDNNWKNRRVEFILIKGEKNEE